MDQVKTGKFIADMRKNADLTQKELAEKLNVSDKLISKWETGRGLPDVSVMDELCTILQINVNELLAGEKISSEDYSKKAEENIMNLVENAEKTKKKSTGFVFGLILMIVVSFLQMLSVVGFGGIRAYLDAPSILYLMGLLIAFLLISGQLRDFFSGIGAAFNQKVYEEKELEQYILCFRTLLSAVPITSAILFITGLISGMYYWYDGVALGPSLAVNSISILYGIMAELLVLIIWTRLKRKQ